MLVLCWPSVCDTGQTLNQHWFKSFLYSVFLSREVQTILPSTDDVTRATLYVCTRRSYRYNLLGMHRVSVSSIQSWIHFSTNSCWKNKDVNNISVPGDKKRSVIYHVYRMKCLPCIYQSYETYSCICHSY